MGMPTSVIGEPGWKKHLERFLSQASNRIPRPIETLSYSINNYKKGFGSTYIFKLLLYNLFTEIFRKVICAKIIYHIFVFQHVVQDFSSLPLKVVGAASVHHTVMPIRKHPHLVSVRITITEGSLTHPQWLVQVRLRHSCIQQNY